VVVEGTQSDDRARLRDGIDASIADWRIPIPQELRADFLKFQYRQNAAYIRLMNIVGFTLFLLYGVADWFAIPDVGGYSAAIRILLYVTLLPATLWLIANMRNVLLLEMLLPASTVVGTVFWFGLVTHTQSENISTYIYAGIIFIVFPNLGIRTYFSTSVAYIALLSALILYYVSLISPDDLEIYVLVMLPFMLISLFISWHNTITSRRMFLYAFIQEMNKDALTEANQRLRLQSQTDPLTGLPNRILVNDRLQQAITKAARDESQFALMIVDLDNFKPINDNHGHEAGDKVLQETARRMVGCVRESDTVARIGGDEFMVLLPVVESRQDAETVARKICEALEQPYKVGEISIYTSSSVGIALFPLHGEDAQALFQHADRAMYRAKAQGRNCVEVAIENWGG
jgi:diguanylate cyclase (GGDEF)-like protein